MQGAEANAIVFGVGVATGGLGAVPRRIAKAAPFLKDGISGVISRAGEAAEKSSWGNGHFSASAINNAAAIGVGIPGAVAGAAGLIQERLSNN